MAEEAGALDRRERRPLTTLYGGGLLVVVVLVTAMLAVAINLRERALEASEPQQHQRRPLRASRWRGARA